MGGAITGISPTITNSVRAHVGPDRPASTPISPDSDEQIEARLALSCGTRSWTLRVLIEEDPGAAPTPLVLAQVEC